jgi:hypothetical protein
MPSELFVAAVKYGQSLELESVTAQLLSEMQ